VIIILNKVGIVYFIGVLSILICFASHSKYQKTDFVILAS